MKRTYLDQNVYNALQDRLHFLFREFENIFVSFSGGKDSGLLLNLVLDFQKKYYPQRRIGLFHQDFEAQYSARRTWSPTGCACPWRRGPP